MHHSFFSCSSRTSRWTSRLFPCPSFCNSAAIDIGVHVSFSISVSSGHLPHCWDCWVIWWFWASLVAQRVKNLPAMWKTWVWSLGGEHPLVKGMATHSSILAWRIPRTEEPGGLYSPWGCKESDTTKRLSLTHMVVLFLVFKSISTPSSIVVVSIYTGMWFNWSGYFSLGFPGGSGKEYAWQCWICGFNPWVGKIPWSRQWQPIPTFFPGKSHGQRNLAGYSPWGRRRGRHNWVTVGSCTCLSLGELTLQKTWHDQSFKTRKLPLADRVPWKCATLWLE